MREDNIKAPPNQREYCRAERIRRGSEFSIRVGLWAPYLIRGANIRVGLGEPLQYCLVSRSLVGTDAGVEPVS